MQDSLFTNTNLPHGWWYESNIPQVGLPSTVEFDNALNKVVPDAKKRVTEAESRWNLMLREYIRNETALRFTFEHRALAVPIKIIDGYPNSFASFVSNIKPEHWIFLLQKNLIQQMAQSLPTLEYEIVPFLLERNVIQLDSPEAKEGADVVGKTWYLLDRVLEQLAILEEKHNIQEINEDLLGAYFFRAQRPEIHLYWMPISALALMLGVSIEALTVVVLTHELAHAYTHIGFDIDGAQWDTNSFAETELAILEGLAQFYTETICKRQLLERFPAANEAYQALLKLQNSVYHAQEHWAPTSKRRGEAVRTVMVQARVSGVTQIGEFVGRINQYLAN